MSLALPGEFPGYGEDHDGGSYDRAPIPGVPAGVMPKLDTASLLLKSIQVETLRQCDGMDLNITEVKK